MNFTLPPFLSKMNKKELIQLGLTGVLIIIFLFFVIHAVTKKQVQQPGDKAKLAPAEIISPEKDKQKELFLKLAEEIKNVELKRDPFAPVSKQASHELSLNGIVWDQENPLAIINDTIVKVGSAVDGNTIVDIQENSVTLTNGSRTLKLELK